MKIDLNARQIAGIIMLGIGIVASYIIATYSPLPFFPRFTDGYELDAFLTYASLGFGLLHTLVMIFDVKSIRLGWVPIAVFCLGFVYAMLTPSTGSSSHMPGNVLFANIIIILFLPIACVIDHCVSE